MNKRNIGLSIIIIIVLGLVSLKSYIPKIEKSSIQIVVLNDEGFSPDSITINLGTQVIWKIKGNHLHWPASNPHPIHNGYPGGGGCIGSILDSCHGLKSGEEFTFTFNDVGVWGMHDHLFPGSVMSVKVVEKSESIKTSVVSNKIVSVAEFRALDYGRQLDIIKNLSSTDPAKAWSYIKDSFIVNGQVVGNAHEFAHIIGHSAYNKFGLGGVKICDDSFAFGCFHGVTEAMLLKEGVGSIPAIEKGCLTEFPPSVSQNYTGCIHGTGHGVYSLEGTDLSNALKDCDIINEPYSQYCYDGVFMENSSSPSNKVFDSKDPWKFCTDLDVRYHRNCARYQSQIFLGNIGRSNPLDVVGGYCAKGPSALLRQTCYQSLGFYITQNAVGKVDSIIKGCQMMPDKEGKEICSIGGAIESVFQKYSGYQVTSKTICNSLSEPRKSDCLAQIGNMLNQNVVKN